MMRIKSLIGERNLLRIGYHKLKSFFAALLYGFPARKLTVVGITGTDGKSTTVAMLHHMLLHTGHRVGSASTVAMQLNEKVHPNTTHLTSISPFSLQKFLRELVKNSVEFAVIEMSSHGLVQGRVDHTYPVASGITNTSLEHLDYHGSMQQYRRDKGIIFHKLRGKGTKVLNIDDESYGMYTAIPAEKTITFSLSGTEASTADIHVWVSDTYSSSQQSSAVLHVSKADESASFSIGTSGTHNIENALCAASCAFGLGIPYQDSLATLTSFTGLAGRLERIDEGQPFDVFVDFAVSPQAYRRALETLQSIVAERSGRVLVLCCSCGNRMKEKRPEIGKVCSELADIVVVTEDETYGEDPNIPIEDIWNAIDQSACEAHKVFDRRQAIEYLFSIAQPGDAVVLCGMGPFQGFNALEGQRKWDERAVAREEIQKLQRGE